MLLRQDLKMGPYKYISYELSLWLLHSSFASKTNFQCLLSFYDKAAVALEMLQLIEFVT